MFGDHDTIKTTVTMCNKLAVAALKIKQGLQQLSLQSVAAFKATAVTTKFPLVGQLNDYSILF